MHFAHRSQARTAAGGVKLCLVGQAGQALQP